VQFRTRIVLSYLALVLGASSGRAQPAPTLPTPSVADECPTVCLPKPCCSGLFHKRSPTACAPCEKTVTTPAPKITVIVPPPEVVFRTAPAPAASAAHVCTKCPHCAKVAAAPSPAPVYAAPAPVYAAPPQVYAAPPPVMVPQMSYQMVPTVSMQAVPTMTYGVPPMPQCAAPPPMGIGTCALPQGNNVGSCAPTGGSNVGSGQGQRFGSVKDIDAEIDRLSNEIRELGKRVLTSAQKHQELEEKLKKDPEIRKLLESK
jgi:hypothetical protein